MRLLLKQIAPRLFTWWPLRGAFVSIALLMLLGSLNACAKSTDRSQRSEVPTPEIFAVPAAPLEPNPDGTGGEMLLTRYTEIVVSRADGRDERILVKASGDYSLLDPSWSPDGVHVAFTQQKLFVPGRQEDYGSDVLLLNRNTGDSRILMTHKTTGEFLRAPIWTPDGQAVLVSRSTPLSDNGRPTAIEFAIERINVNSGGISTLVKDAFGGVLSPDGRKLAYVELVNLTGGNFSERIVLADADGRNPTIIVSDPQQFDRFNPPDFAPDGSRLLFLASGPFSTPPTPVPTRQNRFFSIRKAFANGLPWDLWTVKVDGTELTRLTKLGEDQPWAAWSSDGRFILLQGGADRFVLGSDGSDLRKVGPGMPHTQVDWR